jgi:myosin heavy subunit
MQSLIQTYNYYLQMIRDVTGLNEATDGSTPAERSLVGVQKMAAANSNTACRHILNSGMYLTAEIAEQLSLRISDIIEYSPTKNAFIEAIGAHNVATLEEMSDLHLYDFGIFLELEPDEEEKQLLENNIQTALSQQSIELEDAIDLRAIKNVKLSNQLLKLRRKKKGDEDQKRQLEQTRAQGDAQAQASEAASKAEIEKNKSIMETQQALEELKTQGKSRLLNEEALIKKELMAQEFQYNMQLKQLETQAKSATQLLSENRKDDRTRMQATQQSAMIDQKENQKPAQNFESSGNDVLGGFDVGM